GGANLTTDDGVAQRIKTAGVTHRMLATFGLKPIIGRDILPEEDRPKAPRVVLLSYNLWQRVFHGDRNVTGRVIKFSEQPHTVIGVLPRETVIPPDVDAWTALATDVTRGGSYFLSGVGRLKPGVTLERAQADLVRVHNTIPNNKEGPTSPIV